MMPSYEQTEEMNDYTVVAKLSMRKSLANDFMMPSYEQTEDMNDYTVVAKLSMR